MNHHQQQRVTFEVPEETQHRPCAVMEDNSTTAEYLQSFPDGPKHHEQVEKIRQQVKGLFDAGTSFRIFHGSTNSTRPSASKLKNIIDTSALNKVIGVDPKRMTAVVQPNVPMDTLLIETLKFGLMPLVLTEFPGITVGGAFLGTAGESSSFKHGFFDETVTEAEIVLANGELVACNEKSRADLFKVLPGSLGTFGVVTLLHIKLQRAYKYVETTYHRFATPQEAVGKLQQFAAEAVSSGIDFLDGIVSSFAGGWYIVTGRMVDVNPQNLPVQRIIRPGDPYYFMHATKPTSRQDRSRFLIPLPDYIFRYNRGIFWLGKQTLDVFGINCTERARKLTHNVMTARMGYARLHQQKINVMLIQDLAIPFNAAEGFLSWIHDRYGILPLWLCPLRIPKTPTLHPHHWRESTQSSEAPDMMLNIGLYDASPRTYEEWVRANRDVEEKVHEYGGMKWSYAAQMYDEDTFWAQHDREWYDGLREKYSATTLPNVYQKTFVDVEEGRSIVLDSQPTTWLGQRLLTVKMVGKYTKMLVNSFMGGAWKQERAVEWYEWPDPD